jgi:tetratricopeptide (TPR) repeat protein
MADSRTDDLRRRVDKDPASLAFAQLAEEYRRTGRFEDAVDVCKIGLTRHPGYVSARITLGLALTELRQFERAEHEFTVALRLAPDNLSAHRGIGDLCYRRYELPEALAHYRAALALSPTDTELSSIVADLSRRVSLVADASSRAARTIAALEQWLTAIHVSRTHRTA